MELDELTYETNLPKVLKKQGRKQTWLCEQTDIHPTWMTKLVTGKSIPNVHDAIKIARELDVSIEELWPLPPKEEDE